MYQAVIANLVTIGWAMLIFLASYLANVTFSLWYNIKLQKEQFSREKLITSGLKILTFVAHPLDVLHAAVRAAVIYDFSRVYVGRADIKLHRVLRKCFPVEDVQLVRDRAVAEVGAVVIAGL